ncbi:hypothetical protein ASC87_08315 [Rhizobacter sp. Root1221]|nr:hypothetical protein ASC87_08315 [Rhizobacter sp. Root1221]
MGRGPGGAAGIGHAVARHQGLEAVAYVALLAHGGLTGTHEVTHGFVGTVGNPHGGEVTGTGQAGQVSQATVLFGSHRC